MVVDDSEADKGEQAARMVVPIREKINKTEVILLFMGWQLLKPLG